MVFLRELLLLGSLYSAYLFLIQIVFKYDINKLYNLMLILKFTYKFT